MQQFIVFALIATATAIPYNRWYNDNAAPVAPAAPVAIAAPNGWYAGPAKPWYGYAAAPQPTAGERVEVTRHADGSITYETRTKTHDKVGTKTESTRGANAWPWARPCAGGGPCNQPVWQQGIGWTPYGADKVETNRESSYDVQRSVATKHTEGSDAEHRVDGWYPGCCGADDASNKRNQGGARTVERKVVEHETGSAQSSANSQDGYPRAWNNWLWPTAAGKWPGAQWGAAAPQHSGNVKTAHDRSIDVETAVSHTDSAGNEQTEGTERRTWPNYVRPAAAWNQQALRPVPVAAWGY